MKKKVDGSLPELMTKEQVAEYFGVSEKTIERMMRTGLKQTKLIGRAKSYFTRQNIVDYIDRNLKVP